MLDTVLHFFLTLTQENVIIPVLLVGLFWINRTVFYSGTMLLVLNMIVNHALKITFGVPLMAHLGAGYAFPSGHMSSAVVIYGFVAARMQNPLLTLLIALVIAGTGYALVHFNYHGIVDVLGALGFSILLVYLYTKWADDQKPLTSLINIFIALGLIAYIWFFKKHIPPHVFMAFYTLLGFVLMHFVKPQNLSSFPQRIVATALAFGLVFVLREYALPFFKHQPAYLTQLPWAFAGLMVIIAERFAARFLK